MRGADRRNQLLEVSLDEFSRRGFKGTTTKEIAAAARVTEAVIFQHFPSKEALYTAILDSGMGSWEEDEWLAEIKSCVDRNDDEELFRSLARHIIRSCYREPRFMRLILFAALEDHKLGLARLHEHVAPTFQLILDHIGRRQKQGALTGMDAHTILSALNGMAHHYGLFAHVFGAPIPKASDDEMAESFTRILMHGIRKKRSETKATRKTRQKGKRRR